MIKDSENLLVIADRSLGVTRRVQGLGGGGGQCPCNIFFILENSSFLATDLKRDKYKLLIFYKLILD